MEATAISHIGEKADGTATVRGWLYGKRSSGKIQFLIVRDGTGYLQVVVPKADVPPPIWEAAEKATQETSLSVTGTVRQEKRAATGLTEGDATGEGVAQLIHKLRRIQD